MDIEYFYQLIKNEAGLRKIDTFPLKDLADEYPYFQAAIFAYLKTVYLFSNENFEEELKRLSISINDRRALFYYIFSEEFNLFFEKTGKKEIREDKTSILLNAFFESRCDNGMETELEQTIFSSLASTDYLTYMGASANKENKEEIAKPFETPLKHQNIIDTFISRSEMEGGIQIQIEKNEAIYTEEDNEDVEEDNGNEDELNEDVFFTETLSKIYIKQKKYEKAYKIIKHLSLNYPKKNIYFADQLSFLEKLIINSKFKDKK